LSGGSAHAFLRCYMGCIANLSTYYLKYGEMASEASGTWWLECGVEISTVFIGSAPCYHAERFRYDGESQMGRDPPLPVEVDHGDHLRSVQFSTSVVFAKATIAVHAAALPFDYPSLVPSASRPAPSGSLFQLLLSHSSPSTSIAACSRNSGAAHSSTSKSFLM